MQDVGVNLFGPIRMIVEKRAAVTADRLVRLGMKRSGVGREGVRYAIEEFSQVKFTGIFV